MITVTMPEWFTWMLVFLAVLLAINSCLGVYIEYLKKKIAEKNRSQP